MLCVIYNHCYYFLLYIICLYYKNRIYLLSVYISLLFFSMSSTYGNALTGLLLPTLVPLITNRRRNKCDSNNYRAIAISSLLGKLFDIIICQSNILVYLLTYSCFDLNFIHPRLLCRSRLCDTIECYNEHGSDYYLLLLRTSNPNFKFLKIY